MIIPALLRDYPHGPPPAVVIVLVALFALVVHVESRAVEPVPPPPPASPGPVTTVTAAALLATARPAYAELREETYVCTAYCACEKCCGRWAHYRGGGWTASGTRVKPNHTIAVDPRVIPLGTTVYIEGLGPRRAEDTGSAIKGRRIDIYMETHEAAARFGVQRRKVVVMKCE